ncbi:MAG: hypothetical protein BWY67_00934 [Bacteroidetes bacterium ADurb.Bin397]|nr:MAG: hypothetical protein BWY67_00934 [Bacteroidetes bacterium ADurb.Bin397]
MLVPHCPAFHPDVVLASDANTVTGLPKYFTIVSVSVYCPLSMFKRNLITSPLFIGVVNAKEMESLISCSNPKPEIDSGAPVETIFEVIGVRLIV